MYIPSSHETPQCRDGNPKPLYIDLFIVIHSADDILDLCMRHVFHLPSAWVPKGTLLRLVRSFHNEVWQVVKDQSVLGV